MRGPDLHTIRQRVSGRLLILLCLPMLFACGRGDAETDLVFGVGGAPSELAAWEKVVRKFEADSGISVRLLRQPANSQQQLQGLMVAMKSKQQNPDVFLMDVAWVGLFSAAGWLVPLDNLDRTPFFGELLNRTDVYDGLLMAAPVYLDGGILYYRTDLLEKAGMTRPPETWRELAESAKKVQEQMRPENPGFFGFVWQGAQYEGLVVNFLEFAGASGGIQLQHETGGVRVALKANLKALRFMRDLIWDYEISPPSAYTEMQEEEVRTFFQSGNAMYERNWPYAWTLHQSDGSPVKGKVGIAPLPAPEGEKGVSTLGGYHIGVSKYSDRKADAKKFAAYVTSKEAQRMVVLELGWNPGRGDLYEDEALLERYPHFGEFKDIFRKARPRPVIPYYIQVSNILQTYISGALARNRSPESALEHAQIEIDSLEQRYGGSPKGGGGQLAELFPYPVITRREAAP